MDAATLYEAEPPQLAVGDLFNAQAAQASYQRLVDVINAQAAQIDRLMRRVGALETSQRHAVAAQQHALRQMDVAVAQLERLNEAQIRGREAQRVQEEVTRDMARRTSDEEARLQQVAARLEKLEVYAEETVAKMQKEMAPIELAERLQDDQMEMHKRVELVESRVQSKLDKTELTRLEGIVAKIQTFAPTANLLTTRLNAVEEAHSVVTARLSQVSNRVGVLETDLSQVQHELTRKLDKYGWDQYISTSLDPTLDQMKRDAQATMKSMNQLVNRSASVESSVRALSAKLTSGVASVRNELQSREENILNEIKAELPRNDFDGVVKELRQELSCKAWRRDVQDLSKEVARLTSKMQDVEGQAALSTRFLEWFASRGEAYERNLNVIEHQLDRLAMASAPNVREPFSGQIRYSD